MTEATATMTLTDFLLARIAEDEAVAREIIDAPKRWTILDVGPSWHCDEQSDHVAVAPARVLAECDAKRQIVKIHHNGCPDVWPERCSPCDTQTQPCETLNALAAVYADHPDYNPEWRA